ncbi:hypothetical protein L6452_13790 [Arctium lappa]|uniref:Uncharacterized protein n=1 Tax=Arctium lappa TaxID=4217 RepID=A0ACB9CJ40_ARCLA|nr:hypothetical protein L6452_13790 [Arctium lappa]
MSLQSQVYKNELMMSLGTDTRPPVLINENEYSQWRDRFINFLERQQNGDYMVHALTNPPFERPVKIIPATANTEQFTILKPVDEYNEEESLKYNGERIAKSNLIIALPNHIYNRVDCYKNNLKLMWTHLEKIMLGSVVATQLRKTRYMNSFEEFKAKSGEDLKTVFDRFCAVINDLYKISVEKSPLETNLKFLNALQPEWTKACHRLRIDPKISIMPIQEMFEILLNEENLIVAKKDGNI